MLLFLQCGVEGFFVGEVRPVQLLQIRFDARLRNRLAALSPPADLSVPEPTFQGPGPATLR